MTCHVPHCDQPPSGYGNICTAHRTRMSRHGDYRQNGITKETLRPYIRTVRKRREKNSENLLWGNLYLRWSGVLDHARSVQAHFHSGKPGYWPEYLAALQVLRLTETEPASLVETVLAMYLLLDDRPSLFRSDKAFRTQLVRRVRSLGTLHVGTWFDHRSNRVRPVYRNLSPKAVAMMGQWLAEILGGPGLYLAGLERKRLAQSVREEEELRLAFRLLR